MIVVSDTSVITNLAAIAHLHLLPQLYSPITIPRSPQREGNSKGRSRDRPYKRYSKTDNGIEVNPPLTLGGRVVRGN